MFADLELQHLVLVLGGDWNVRQQGVALIVELVEFEVEDCGGEQFQLVG